MSKGYAFPRETFLAIPFEPMTGKHLCQVVLVQNLLETRGWLKENFLTVFSLVIMSKTRSLLLLGRTSYKIISA